jgi:hypothetical protein
VAAIKAQTAALLSNPLFLAAATVAAGVMLVAVAVKKHKEAVEGSNAAMEETPSAAAKQLSSLESLTAESQRLAKATIDITVANANGQKPKWVVDAEKDAEKYGRTVADMYRQMSEIDNYMSKEYGTNWRSLEGTDSDRSGSVLRGKLKEYKQLEADIATVRKVAADDWTKKEYDAGKSASDSRAKALEQMRMDLMGEHEKELATLKNTYDERIKLFRGNEAAIKEVNTWYAIQRFEVNKKYEDEELKSQTEANKARADAEKAMTSVLLSEQAKVIEAHKERVAAINAMESQLDPGVVKNLYLQADDAKIESMHKVEIAERDKANKILGINLTSAQKLKQSYEDDVRLYQSKVDAGLDAEGVFAAAVIRLRNEMNQAVNRLELESLAKIPGNYAAKEALLKANLESELKLYADNEAAKAQLQKNFASELKRLHEEQKQAEWASWKESIKPVEEWGGAAVSVANSVASVLANANSNAIKDIEKRSSKELEAVNNSRMSERAKAAETKRIQEQTAQEKLDLETKQWKMDMAMAVVNSAAAVVKTMASIPFPLNLPSVIAQTAAGAAQVAIIAQNKPKMQFGGFVPGQSWSGDQVDIRANSGEAVLTPAQQRNFMLMANGDGSGGTRTTNIGDTNIVINGGADSATVDAIGQTLAEHRQGILDILYDAERRGEIDHTRLALA